MRTARLILLALTATAATVHAAPSATPRLETIDHGDTVEIVARGAIAADAAKVGVVRERVEIPLSNVTPEIRRLTEDSTALLVEIRGDAPRVLSIKLRHDHNRVLAIAPSVTFTQIGDELHVTIPRTLPVAKEVAPATPAVEQPTAAAAPPPAPTAPPEPAPRALAPAPAATPAPAAPPLAQIAGASSPGATGGRWWMMLGGLALVGGGVVVALRRKKSAVAPENQLEIIATRSLGGKARVVWLGAGDHEIVVAITAQQIRPLARWRRPATAAARTAPVERGFGRALEEAGADVAFAPRPATEPAMARGSSAIPRMRSVGSSPAISGLLRLRDRTPVPPAAAIDTFENEFDDDAQWTRNRGGNR